MTVTAQAVVDLYAKRKMAAGPALARMAEVQQMYDGDIVVPLPELNRNEKSAVQNRVKQGLTQFAERIASVTPNLWCPPVRPGIDKSEKQAHDRRRALLGWWSFSRQKIVLRQRARYLQGYGSSPVEICWDLERGVPQWRERNPLTTFPGFMSSPADLCPADCIFETQQPLAWLTQNYPLEAGMLAKPRRQDGGHDPDHLYRVLRYLDAEECVLVVLGERDQAGPPVPASSLVRELDRYPNRAECCPVVVPRQFSLSKAHGQFDGMAGMHHTEAMLTAMSIIATQKGVFADEWLVAHPGEEPLIVQVPDSREGIPGIVKGGTLVPRGVDPQFQTNQTIDRLADAQMRQAGLSSELQGLAPTNVRTGIRAQNLLSNVIDFPIQEAQELLAESLMEENKRAVAFAKGYGGPKSFYVRWDGEQGPVTYDPKTTFETDENVVSYALAGADQAGLVISGGQRVGMGTMSKRRFMEIDPLVDDAEREYDRIVGEQLTESVLESLKQQALQGQIPPNDMARIVELVTSDRLELFAAINKAHEEAQARQATPAPEGAPEGQPGLSMPGMGAEQPGPQAPPDLASLLAGLRRPQTGATPQELGAA